jgi:hypothetical protein
MPYRKKPLQGLGSIAGTVTTALDVSLDPYLPETICRVGQLAAVENRRPVPPCNTTAPGLPGGIGLRNAMVPLRGYVYLQQHKWAYPLVVAAAVGLPMYIGYLLGKGSR